MFVLLRYESSGVALNCGIMLRECFKHEPLAKFILEAEEFFNFFKFVESSTFDIASDAFSTFKVRFHAALFKCYFFIYLINNQSINQLQYHGKWCLQYYYYT